MLGIFAQRLKNDGHMRTRQTFPLWAPVPIGESLFTIFCLISTRLSFPNQSAEIKVLNIESALHNELYLKI